MPPVLPNNDRRLGATITQIQAAARAGNSQKTTYAVDPDGVCQAIVGNLEFDQNGTPTGLGAVWGFASFRTGSWVHL